LIELAIEKKQQIHHTVVNAGKMVLMQKDQQLFKSVVEADIINPDGMPLVWLSKLYGKPIPERVAGIDLMQNLVKIAFEKNYKVFFFGAKEEIVKKVVEIYSEKYSKNIIAGYRNGYYDKEEEESIAVQIAESKANLLFVAISSPKKENFLYQYRDVLSDVNFIMGVGGSFDVVAGKVKRAPLWMQNSGLEWFYRFMQEPLRMWKRYIFFNMLFICYILKDLVLHWLKITKK